MIVPTVNGADRIGSLLESLSAQSADHQLLVVDNGSRDGTRGVLAGHPEAEVIRCEENLGFSRAMNLAALRADGDAVVMLNDDCVCDPGFVESIVQPLGGDVVMSAGVLRDSSDERRIDTAGLELSPTLLVFDYLHGLPLDVLSTAAAPIGPSAAAAAFDRAAFLDAGGFDEALFAYWEDVDLVLRLVREGGRSALSPEAQGTHQHSATLGSGSVEKNRLMGFGRGYVLRKWSVLRGGRLPRVLAEDGVIGLGQAVMDRSTVGLIERFRGARSVGPVFPYPAESLGGHPSSGLVKDLRRRLARRRRVRRSRRERETALEGVARELGAGAPAPAGPGAADLTVAPEAPVRVGAGNVVFLAGRISPAPVAEGARLLVDGEPSPEPVRVVSSPAGGPGYWWTTLELPASAALGQRRLGLGSDAATTAADLGSVAVDPATKPGVSADAERAAAAVASVPARPLVAICMATYEPPLPLFEQQLDSIRGQTHEAWVCVISDDGSSPERLEKMRRLIEGDPRVVLLEHASRLGFYRNYERALAAVPSEVDLIALADQDDRWRSEKLDELIAAIGEKDLVYSDMRVVDDSGRVISDTYWSMRRNNYTDLASMMVGNTVTGAAAMFRADLLQRALPFPVQLGDGYHDHWLALTAMTGRGLTYVDRPLQDYVQHGDATQGHAEANAGARYMQPRLIGILAWQGLRALLGGRAGRGWARRYFAVYTRTGIWARVLLMRSSGLNRRQRRILSRFADPGASPAALAWLAGRSLRPLWGANEAFGRELLILSSALWERSLMARSRRRARARLPGS